MTTPLLCERVERRHPQEKCASKCVRGIVLSAFIYFLAQMDLRFEISRVRFEVCNSISRVWLTTFPISDCQLPICSSPCGKSLGETRAKT